MIALLTLFACSGDEEATASPTVEWLTPADGDTVTAGDVACSLVIGFFSRGSSAFRRQAASSPVPQTIASWVAPEPVMWTLSMPGCSAR